MINKKWFSIIYVFFILTLVWFLWIVILNKQSLFEKQIENNSIENILNKKIIFNWSNYLSSIYDITSRDTISWVIPLNSWYNYIYSVNSDIRNFINTITWSELWWLLKIWNVQTWIVYLEVNDAFSWKIIETNKTIYDNDKRLTKVNEFLFSSTWAKIWYLQNSWSISTWTLNVKNFDFKNKDYLFFINYSSWGDLNLRYNLKIYNKDLTWVYINPLTNTWNKIEYLWNYWLENNWKYILKSYKITSYDDSNNYKSCKNIFDNKKSNWDWYYYIYPDWSSPIAVYCDMSNYWWWWTLVYYSNSWSVSRSLISSWNWNIENTTKVNFSILYSMRNIKNWSWSTYNFYIKDSSDIERENIFRQSNSYLNNPVWNNYTQEDWNFYYSSNSSWSTWYWLWLWNYWKTLMNTNCTLSTAWSGISWNYCLQDQSSWNWTWPWFYDYWRYDTWSQLWVKIFQR